MKTNIINEIKTLLGIELELAQAKLENGTVLEAEAFEAGNEIFIVTEDEKVAVPVGEYEMEDGRILVVKDEGVIDSIVEKNDEPKEDEAEEVEAEEKEEELADDKEKEEMYVSKKEFETAVEEIKAMIEKMMEPKEEKEEAKKEEMSAAVEPIAHSPEIEKAETKFQIGQNKPQSTMDRVLARLSK
jgi:hypothetical protein